MRPETHRPTQVMMIVADVLASNIGSRPSAPTMLTLQRLDDIILTRESYHAIYILHLSYQTNSARERSGDRQVSMLLADSFFTVLTLYVVSETPVAAFSLAKQKCIKQREYTQHRACFDLWRVILVVSIRNNMSVCFEVRRLVYSNTARHPDGHWWGHYPGTLSCCQFNATHFGDRAPVDFISSTGVRSSHELQRLYLK